MNDFKVRANSSHTQQSLTVFLFLSFSDLLTLERPFWPLLTAGLTTTSKKM